MQPCGQSPPIWERLTDHRLYTGTHKLRFDDSGHGRGLSGRDPELDSAGQARSRDGRRIRDLSEVCLDARPRTNPPHTCACPGPPDYEILPSR
jgi:hypothetical protein